MKPWIGYIRVSSVGDRQGPSFRSPSDQRANIEQWAAGVGITVDFLEPELDRSGGDSTRPILNEAIAAVERGTHAGVVSSDLSRFSRDTLHFLTFAKRLTDAGGLLHFVDEGVDRETTSGQLTQLLVSAFAEQALVQSKKRFANLRTSTVARGIWQPRRVPRGYLKDPETRTLIPDPDTAEDVRQAFALRAQGEPWRALARRMEMTPTGVRRMMSNRVYLGEVRIGEDVNTEAHQPLVTVAEFKAAISPPRRARSSQYEEPALLSKLVRCGSCSGLMSRGGAPGTSRGVVYTCQTNGPCDARAVIRTNRLERFVVRAFHAEISSITGSIDSADQIDSLRDGLTRAQDELAAYLSATALIDTSLPAFAEAAAQRADDVRRAQAAYDGAVRAAGTSIDILAEWPTWSQSDKAESLRATFEAVVVWRSGRRTVPVGDRAQIWKWGSGLVPARQLDSDGRRHVRPLPRLDSDDPRVAAPALDPADRVSQ